MSNARDALYNLADQENETPQETSQGLTKDDVSSAINDYFVQQEEAAQRAEQQERQRKISEQREIESQERSEITAVVKQSLQQAVSKDKAFAELVQNSDLPGGLVDYIAEVGEADEAPLIVREIASNEEYKQKLKRAKRKWESANCSARFANRFSSAVNLIFQRS